MLSRQVRVKYYRVKALKTKYRYSMILLKQLVITDFKLRYQGSVLGYLWSVLRPLLLFVILYTVFVKGLKFGGDIPNFPIYLLLGLVIWGFFAEMTSMSLTSIVARGDLIRKIRIPRWILVASTSISALINLALNLLVVFGFMLFTRSDLLRTSILLPLILLQAYLFSLGLSLLLSASFVKYRDVSYIWEVVLQAGFYTTPIIYSLSKVTDPTIQKIMLLNPIATAMQDARYVLVTHSSPTISSVYGGQIYRLLPYGIVVIIFIVGLLYFKKESKNFAENL